MENLPKTEAYTQPTLDQALLEQQQTAVTELRSQALTPEDHAVVDQWEQEYATTPDAQASAEAEQPQNVQEQNPMVVNAVQEGLADEAAAHEAYAPQHMATETTDADFIDETVKDLPNVIDNRTPKHMKEAEPDSRNLLIGERDADTAASRSSAEALDGEPTAEQLDRNLRGLISNYRKNKDQLTAEQLEENRDEIFDAFDQLAKGAGWSDEEVNAKQVMLFEQMAKNKSETGSTAQKFEELVAKAGERSSSKKAKVMDNVVDYLGGGEVPELKDVQPLDQPLAEQNAQDVLTMRDEEFWAESNKPRFARMRKFGRRLMQLAGFGEVEVNTSSPAYEAIQQIKSGKTSESQPQAPVEVAPAASAPNSGRPSINAERVLSPEQVAALEEEQRKLREQGESARTVA